VELPLECEIVNALMVGVGGSDPMDYHALEALQCMVERRKGGETGVYAVQMLEGDAVWEAGKERAWSYELLEAALSRSDTPCGLTLEDGRTQDLLDTSEPEARRPRGTEKSKLEKLVDNPSLYLIDYADGLRGTLLMLNGAVRDYCFATRLKGNPVPVSTQFFLTPTPNVTYSACLIAKIEQLFETGVAPYPAERTLLVSGTLESCLTSRLQGQVKLETPHLAVEYRAPAESQYARR